MGVNPLFLFVCYLQNRVIFRPSSDLSYCSMICSVELCEVHMFTDVLHYLSGLGWWVGLVGWVGGSWATTSAEATSERRWFVLVL